MNKWMKTGLLLGLLTVAGGLPLAVAQENFNGSALKESDQSSYDQQNPVDGFLKRSEHCNEWLDEAQHPRGFHHRFENRYQNEFQQHHSSHMMHRGNWQR